LEKRIVTRAEIRADFIKRLFAVAISVGAATSFVQMDWVKDGVWPNISDWERLTILAVGMFATVLSWDGYLVSIDSKPLGDYWRFTIDIILVFIYMFLLISSRRSYLWLPTLAIIFILYVLWDMLTVREHMKSYDSVLSPAGDEGTYRAGFVDVLRVYGRGFLDRPDTNRGPIITFSWAVFFLILAVLNYVSTARYQVFVTCAFATVGLFLYRRDKVVQTRTATIRGYRMFVRTLLIVTLLSLAGLYFCAFAISPSAPQHSSARTSIAPPFLVL
jgi:hypothetical protein